LESERLVVGRVAKAHGLNGEVAVDVYSDDPDRFQPGARVFINEREITIATARAHQGRMLVRFEDVTDRTMAEALRGGELTIPREEARELGEGSFYPHELAGMSVEDESGRTLGTMVRVDESPASDLWVVRSGNREVLMPAVRDIVIAVDADRNAIVVRPPDGLF